MKKRCSKAQSISINAIIIAALGLFVLVILLIIFSGKMNQFTQSTGCAARGGACMSQNPQWNGACPPEKPVSIMSDDCNLVSNYASDSQNKRPGQCCISIG